MNHKEQFARFKLCSEACSEGLFIRYPSSQIQSYSPDERFPKELSSGRVSMPTLTSVQEIGKSLFTNQILLERRGRRRSCLLGLVQARSYSIAPLPIGDLFIHFGILRIAHQQRGPLGCGGRSHGDLPEPKGGPTQPLRPPDGFGTAEAFSSHDPGRPLAARPQRRVI